MKSYAIEKNKNGEQCEYITLMKKRMTGKISHTRRAPSRLCLEMFGGTVTIEEFRAGTPCVVRIPGEFYQEQQVTKQNAPVGPSAFVGGGELKLKREKPLERTKGKLETSLGIIRKCPPAAASLGGPKSQSKTKA
jgi:hypothetical protein